jgi:hypothetical protein
MTFAVYRLPLSAAQVRRAADSAPAERTPPTAPSLSAEALAKASFSCRACPISSASRQTRPSPLFSFQTHTSLRAHTTKFDALCFDTLTRPFCRNPLILISMQNPRGCTPLQKNYVHLLTANLPRPTVATRRFMPCRRASASAVEGADAPFTIPRKG